MSRFHKLSQAIWHCQYQMIRKYVKYQEVKDRRSEQLGLKY